MKVIGYVFNQPHGRYKEKWYFEGTAEKIALFIMINKGFEVTITDASDNLVCNSLPGGFIDICTNQEFLRRELLPCILTEQYKNTRLEFEETEDRVMKEI